MNYKHVIWDWNGTLVNDTWLCLEIINDMLTRRKMAITTLDAYHDYFDFPVIRYYEKLGFDWTKESFDDVSLEFITAYEKRRNACTLYDDALEIIQLLNAKKVTQSVLSAYAQQYLERAVQQYGLSSYFSLLTGNQNIRADGKEHLSEGHKSALNYMPEEILFIGDTTHDFAVAQKMGVDCLLVAQGHHSYDRLKVCGASTWVSLTLLKETFAKRVV